MGQKELSHAKRYLYKAPVVIATGTLVDNNMPVVDDEHKTIEEDSFYSSHSRHGSSAGDSQVEGSASIKIENILTIMTTDGQTILFEKPYYCDTNNWTCPHCDRDFCTEHEVMVHSLSCKYNSTSPLALKMKSRPHIQHSTQEGVEVQSIEVKMQVKNRGLDTEMNDHREQMFSFEQDDIRNSLENSREKQRKVGIFQRLFLSCFSRRKCKRKNTTDTFDTTDSFPLTSSETRQSKNTIESNQLKENVRPESNIYSMEEMSLTCSSFTTNSTGESRWFRDNGSYEMELVPNLLGKKAHLQNPTTVPSSSIFDGMTFEPFLSIVREME